MKLSEVIVYVEDMAAQVAFYRDVLGLVPAPHENVEDGIKHGWLTFETGACVLALHAGGKRRFGEDAPKFVFSVADIEAERDRLVGRGVSMDQTFSPAPGIFVSNGLDPEGNRFSIEQNPHHPH